MAGNAHSRHNCNTGFANVESVCKLMGEVALVTGAGEGIGAAVVLALARAGLAVAVNDIAAAKAEAVAAQAREVGVATLAVPADVGDVAQVHAMVDSVVARFGRLDVAVANAGITLYGDFFDYTPEAFDRVLAVNLRGSFFTVQAAARQMRAQGSGGRIVLTSSVTGHQAVRYLSAYGMTKAALEMLARSLVLELSPHDITINAVAPGATITPRNLADDPDYIANWSEVVPLGRIAPPEDIAAAVTFFCSDAARHITGQTLVVDGGWTATSPTPGIRYRTED